MHGTAGAGRPTLSARVSDFPRATISQDRWSEPSRSTPAMMDDMPESSITSNRRWMRKPRRALRRAHAPPKYGRVYVLWAEGTTRFKIGFSSSDVRNRAADIESCSPYPIRIVGDWAGTTHIESMLHSALVKYRSHREWFILPEDAAWWLLLGKWRADVPAGVTT